MKNKETPEERRSCYDCSFCKGYVSLWCLNEGAIKARGTRMPGVIHCPYWNSNKTKREKTFWIILRCFIPFWGIVEAMKGNTLLRLKKTDMEFYIISGHILYFVLSAMLIQYFIMK